MQATHTKNPFDLLGLDPILLRAVYGLGYEAPTPIQKEAIPAILSGRDVIGTAQTGSGKTAAFLLPILQRLMKQSPGRTRALVLSPTRDLAAQIEVALRGLAKGTRIHGHAVYGGVGMSPQEHALRAGVDVVVATPGRLLDHMSRRNVDFRGLQVLVLDEADRMLDMGFLPDVRRIVDALPRERQTLLFSATMAPEIEALSRTIMRNPVRISVSPPHRPPSTIRHEVYPVPQHLKTSLLVHLLGREDMLSVLVFVRTKRRADRVRSPSREGKSLRHRTCVGQPDSPNTPTGLRLSRATPAESPRTVGRTSPARIPARERPTTVARWPSVSLTDTVSGP